MALLCILLLIACLYDYRQRRIPNWLMLVGAVLGLCRELWRWDAAGIPGFLVRSLGVTLGMYILFKIGSLGAGDVKLFGVCAGYLSGDKILYFLFFSLLFAAGISLIKIIAERNGRERLEYLWEYLREVICTGQWQLYFADKRQQYRSSICLTGPILCSVLLCMGGVY